jgi:RecA/RadA recombinase
MLISTIRDLNAATDASERGTPLDAQRTEMFAKNIMAIALRDDSGGTRRTMAKAINFLEPTDLPGFYGLALAIVKNLIEKAGSLPNAEFVDQALLEEISADQCPNDEYQELKRYCQKMNHAEFYIVWQELDEFLKERAWKRFVLGAMESLKAKDYDQIRRDYELATSCLVPNRQVFDVYKTPELAFEGKDTEHLQIALPSLQSLLNEGGPCRREVIQYLGRTGVGKSTIMANDAVHSAKNGQKTLVIGFENNVAKTWQKFYGILTGIETRELEANRHKLEFYCQQEIIDGMHSCLKANRWDSKSASADDVREAIRELKTQGWNADVVILDYLELMVPCQSSDRDQPEYLRQKAIAEDLKRLAQEEDVLVITAVQSNREGAKRGADLDLHMIGESYAKAHSTDYIVALNQTPEEQFAAQPELRVSIIKNRNGEGGRTIKCYVNYQTQRIAESPDQLM